MIYDPSHNGNTVQITTKLPLCALAMPEEYITGRKTGFE